MNTPIYDFLKGYADKNTARLHMPGHKGKSPLPELEKLYSLDITEIFGADSLFEANGIIRESEKNASALFGTEETCYSAGGSTLGIQAMLAIMKMEGRRIVAVRNVHRSFISACAFLNIEPEWIYPVYSNGILSGEIPLEKVENKLSEGNACLYVTSPDYLGKQADIAKLSELCRKYDAFLIVDNAHGAHTAFAGKHPIACGADMCCDSAHKMLPALTGGAYLHIGNKRFCSTAKHAMSLFGSTSPSYLILASLDLCNRYIEQEIDNDINRVLSALARLRKEISCRFKIYSGEPFHLTILCRGEILSLGLRTKNIECEYSDKGCIVLLFSPLTTVKEIEYVQKVLMEFEPIPAEDKGFIDFPVMEQRVSIAEAALAKFETVPVEKAVGRICGAVNVPCPPAVPIAVSGEIISDECVKIYKRYGILTVNVLK